jgi:acetylornithine deacetylase/succinyl-diaminopimelate desuccinylase family protein
MDDLEWAVLDHIDQDEAVEFLRALIQTPSATSGYLGGQPRAEVPPGDCRAIATVCASKLDEARLPYRVLGSHKKLPNLLAQVEGQSMYPCLLFHAHMDTVPAGNPLAWHYDPFSAEVVDGVIYGLGAGDCKGSVAAQFMAAKAIAESGLNTQGTLQLAAVADEEAGGRRGTKWLHDQGDLRSNYVVVGEQTDNRVAVAERSAIWIELAVRGRAAHGALPWMGDNTIVKMARIIQRLEDELAPRLAERSHPYLSQSSMNIGTIQGGIKPNIVPDTCRIQVDRRVFPGESREEVLAEIRYVIDEAATEFNGLDYELHVLMDDTDRPVETDPSSRFVLAMQEAVRDVVGEDREIVGYAQGSDARFFSGDDVPIVIFGPTDPALGHAPNEHIRITELVEAARILALTAIRILGVSD